MNDQISILGQQIPLALLLVFFQNWLKNQKWFPWLTHEAAQANHLFSIVATALVTVGIHITLNTAGHTLTITWPTLSVFLMGLWHWAQQYVFTKFTYKIIQPQLANGNRPLNGGATK